MSKRIEVAIYTAGPMKDSVCVDPVGAYGSRARTTDDLSWWSWASLSAADADLSEPTDRVGPMYDLEQRVRRHLGLS